MMRSFFCPDASFNSARSWLESDSRSISCRSSLMASAPIPALKSSSYFSRMSRYSFSERIWFFDSGQSPGSVTM